MKKRVALLSLIAMLGIGAGFAVAVAPTTGTVTACATASTPAHTVAVDGAGVSTIPGDTNTACTTATYTIPTTTTTTTATTTVVSTATVTTTVTGTTTAPTTTATTGYTNTSLPTISGSATVGSTLTASPGTWSPTPPAYDYLWEQCDTSGTTTGCITLMSGETATTYVVQSTDVGHRIFIRVAPSINGTHDWTDAVFSAPTAVVATSGSIVFDGRATRMTALSSYETTPGTLSTLVQTQNPAGMWDCLCFLNNDIALVSEPRYTQVYSINVGINSHNPNYTPSDARSSELSHIQPMTLGTWNWYGDAFRVKSGWSQPDWSRIFQFGYPSLASPPIALAADAYNGVPYFQLWRNDGLLNASTLTGTVVGDTPIMAIPLDTWVEFVVGVKWATDNTGSIRIYYRIPSQSSAWTLAYSVDNTPTEQYGTTANGSCSADYHDCTTVTDHGGLYFGYWSAPPLPSPFPTNHIDQSGLTISSDLATAQSTFP